MHAKDLVVREVLTGSVPSAGVGTCFSRDAMLLLMENGQEPFNSATLTEDYDIATRLAARGQTSIIAQYPVEFRVRRRSLLGMGPSQILQFEMPLCVREHFPNTIRTSYRQKARWTLGIALQGWEQLGWSKSPIANYFLFRDRKAILTPTLAIVGYFLAINYIVLNIASSRMGLPRFLLFDASPFETSLLIFNAFALLARVAQRMYFTHIIYGWGHAMMALPRIFLASVVNFLATMRALRIFVRSKITKENIAWDKTAHRFPTREWLVQDKRALGDILVEWEAVSATDRDAALIEQSSTGENLGVILLRKGLDEMLLTEAVASQTGLPFTEVNLEAAKAFHGRLPADVSLRLRALPIGVSDKGRLKIAFARPLSDEESKRMIERLGGKFVQLIAPESQLVATIKRLNDETAPTQKALGVPLLHEMLLEGGLVSRKAIKTAMRKYRPALHGTFGEYLVARGIIDGDIIAKLALEQRLMIVDQQKETA
ncbi:glycosyltransferase [Altererythrobacter confluentis]|uniref:Glycosyltransferase n=1 Tax=Allopontixanthobacter confluentis TaxID=1849021 RepID=A0A6L7GJ72_9SPHN|nr:glycosyltransferase family 2 protein [Allopontixanthobacter confluentis]MXP15635.1 glycosyltransferase [Allopontixanthobacter confluentis]